MDFGVSNSHTLIVPVLPIFLRYLESIKLERKDWRLCKGYTRNEMQSSDWIMSELLLVLCARQVRRWTPVVSIDIWTEAEGVALDHHANGTCSGAENSPIHKMSHLK